MKYEKVEVYQRGKTELSHGRRVKVPLNRNGDYLSLTCLQTEPPTPISGYLIVNKVPYQLDGLGIPTNLATALKELELIVSPYMTSQPWDHHKVRRLLKKVLKASRAKSPSPSVGLDTDRLEETLVGTV